MFQLRPYQQKLVDGARSAYRQGFKAPCVVSPCGSGKSIIIAEIARITSGRVLFLVHRGELRDQIRNTFIKSGVDMSRVEVGMVQTIARRLDKTLKPDLIITDEGHHGSARSYQKIYEHFPSAYRLGFTATPVRLGGEGLEGTYDTIVEGPSVRWLIDNHCLAPYRLFAPELLDRKTLKKSHGDFTAASIEDAFGSKIYGDVVATYKKLADGKKAICYCAGISSSLKAVQEFNNAGIPAAHIDGKTPKDERDRIISDFRDGRIKILSNVDIVGEGFDVPDCEVSILLRPTKSLSLYIQQAMRCMRYMPDKEAIIVDHVGNCLEHGLPDEDREWALGGIKKRTTGGGEKGVLLRTCDECFQVWLADDGRICPHCGHEQKIKERELTVDETVDLREVGKNDAIIFDSRQPSDCKNMNELYDLAKNKGYKPGWAYYQGKKRGLI